MEAKVNIQLKRCFQQLQLTIVFPYIVLSCISAWMKTDLTVKFHKPFGFQTDYIQNKTISD